jgi:D-tyrosyl-tRNA(Tyr) deacylase
MRLVIQRVSKASVEVDHQIVGQIDYGLLVLFGVSQNDHLDQIDWLVKKLIYLRIFSDNFKKMNLSLLDIEAEMLVVSQFTLYADCKQGRRPSLIEAAKFEQAQFFYEKFIEALKVYRPQLQTGVFGADMLLSSINQGPMTLIVDAPDCRI